jgi:HEAT repeat protein
MGKTRGTTERRTRPKRAWSPLVWAVVIAAGLASPAWASDADDRAAARARERQVVNTILESLTSDRAPSRELVVTKLAERGPIAIPAILSAGRRLKDPVQVEAITLALRRMNRESMEKYLFALVTGDADEKVIAMGWRHIGNEGGRAAVSRVIGVMPGNSYRVKRAVEVAFVRLLRRHDGIATYRAIEEALKEANRETRCRVVSSIGETDSRDGLELLVRLAGRWPGVDHAIVSAISRMPEAGLAERVVPCLREMLENDEMNIRRETVTALAVFADVDSVKDLIEFLDDGERGMRGNSLWALRSISGLEFPESRERWDLWYQDEINWWEAEGIGLFETLLTGTNQQIVLALGMLSEHRLHRTTVSVRIRQLLSHPDADVRDAAALALVRLGLTEARGKSDIRASFATRGFEAVTPAQMRAEIAAADDRGEKVADSGSQKIVPYAGLAILLVLFGRIFGSGIIDTLRKLGSSRKAPEGPVTVRLGKRWGKETP